MNMCKNVTIVLSVMLLSGIFTFAHSEITVGILKSVNTKGETRLIRENIPVLCKPLGIVVLEEMATEASEPEQCRAAIRSYFTAHPHDQYFGREHLHKEQSYHYDLVGGGCILYANATQSYSEMVLEQGLALPDPDFNHIEWNKRFQRALKGAETNKRGLHGTEIKKMCVQKEK